MCANSVAEGSGVRLAHPGWRVVAAGFLGVMVSFGSMLVFTFGIFLKPLTAQFGWTRADVSGAFALAALTVAATSPLLGRWLDRYGPRRVILPCMAVFGVAFASLSLLRPFIWRLYATFVVLGAVGNGTTQMGYSRAVSSWFGRGRGLALSCVIAGVGVGSIVFPLAAQAIIDTSGWRVAYATLGAVILLFGIPLTALWVVEKPPERRVSSSQTSELESVSFREGLLSAPFWIIVAMLLLSSVSINGAITHVSALLTDRGVAAGAAAFAASALGGASFCSRLLTGWLLDRFFGPRIALLLMCFTTAGILLLAHAGTFFTGICAAALIGLALGGEAVITPYLLTRYFGLRSFSGLYGVTWTFYAVAGALGPILLGRAFDLTGSYVSLLHILAGGTFAAAMVMLLMPRYPTPIPADQ